MKKSKKFIVGIVLIAVGSLAIIGGITSKDYDVGTICACLVIAAVGGILLLLDRKGRKSGSGKEEMNQPDPQPAKQYNSKTDPADSSDLYKIENHHVAGTSHYVDNIESLAVHNDDFDLSKRELIEDGLVEERIWENIFYVSNAELAPEPDNPYDKNAIKVLADGKCIGYIKKGSCSHLLNAINAGKIISVNCKIGGGAYKYLCAGDVDADGTDVGDEKYALEKDASPYFAILEIKMEKQ